MDTYFHFLFMLIVQFWHSFECSSAHPCPTWLYPAILGHIQNYHGHVRKKFSWVFFLKYDFVEWNCFYRNMNALYSWAMCNVFEDFSPSKWDEFFSADFPIFKKYPDMKFMYLHCANSDNILEKYLNSIVNSTNSQIDLVSIFDNIVHHTRHNHTEFILNYFMINFDALQNKYVVLYSNHDNLWIKGNYPLLFFF